MAVSNYIKNENAVYLALGYNVNQPIPLDSRLVVTEYDGLTQASFGDDIFYDGIIVSVVQDPDESKNGVYQLIHMPSSDINNWHKLTSADEINKAINAIKVKVNNVNGVNTNGTINVALSGDSITLGDSYNGQVIKGLDGNSNPPSPTKTDSINASIKKLVDIIVEDEENAKKSLKELGDKINNVSGNSVTNVSLDATKTKLVIQKNGHTTEIPLTDLAKIYTFDTVGDKDHNVIFSVKEQGGKVTVQGNLVSLDCGEYEGETTP